MAVSCAKDTALAPIVPVPSAVAVVMAVADVASAADKEALSLLATAGIFPVDYAIPQVNVISVKAQAGVCVPIPICHPIQAT